MNMLSVNFPLFCPQVSELIDDKHFIVSVCGISSSLMSKSSIHDDMENSEVISYQCFKHISCKLMRKMAYIPLMYQACAPSRTYPDYILYYQYHFEYDHIDKSNVFS